MNEILLESQQLSNHNQNKTEQQYDSRDEIVTLVDQLKYQIGEILDVEETALQFGGENGAIVGSQINFASGFAGGAICGLLVSILFLATRH